MRSILFAGLLTFVSQVANAAINMPFEMPWMNSGTAGTMFRTADYPNGIFVLEAFANFCGACNENATNVDALATAYANQPRVHVLDMTLDSNDRETQRWIATHNPNHKVIKDVGRSVWGQVGGQYIPTVLVVDCHGEIHYQNTGVWTSSVKQAIRRTIDGLLAQDCQ